MAAPQNSQGFVQPSSGGVGNWLGKFFGGISQEKRSRSAAQLQLDLHAGKADVDTFHRKERTTWDMATKDAGAELAYDRSGREIERGIGAAPRMEKVGLKGFDTAGRPDMQATGQKPKVEKASTDGATVTNTPTQTPPTDRASNPARRAKTRNATLKDTTAALSAGKIDQEQAAEMSPTFARNLGKKTAAESVSNPDSATTMPKVRKTRTPKAEA
jgi:hypothetical protein